MRARARTVDVYENKSRKQLKNILTNPCTPIPTSKPVPRPNEHAPAPASRPKKRTPKPKIHTPTSISTDDI